MRTDNARDALAIRIRLVRMAALALPVWGALFTVFFVTDLGGLRGGWLWAPVVAAVAAAPVGWFGWGRYRGRAVAATILALGGIAFGIWNSQNAILSHGRLRVEMDSISVPPDFVASGDMPGGWSLCFDVCTNYERSWVVTASPQDAEAWVTQVLEGQGFVLGPWDTHSSIGSPVVLGHRGRVGVTVMVETKSVLRNGHDAPLGPGEVGVEVVLDTYL